MISLMEDKDQIVICDPATLEKVLIYQIPTFHLGVSLHEFQFLDENGQVMLISKHLVCLLSFTSLQRGKMGQALEQWPVEHEVPKPMFLFGKEISITGSLAKWEESLTTNTHTNYQEQVSLRALKITSSKTPQAAQSEQFFPHQDHSNSDFKGVPHSTRNANPRLEAMEETKLQMEQARQ